MTGEIISKRLKKMTLKKPGRGQHSKYNPTAFTEKGLYMLATILKELFSWIYTELRAIIKNTRPLRGRDNGERGYSDL
jgi:type VI protein secretion system component VasA